MQGILFSQQTDVLIGTLAARVTELPERVCHPAIGLGAILQRKRDGLVARHKGVYLCQCLQSLGM